MRDLADVSEQLFNARQANSDTPLTHRIYIRILCTTIEGDTSARKQLALAMRSLGKATISNRDLALLRDERVFTKNGRERKFTQVEKSIRHQLSFSFCMFARYLTSPNRTRCKADFRPIEKIESGKMLNLFHETVECRNRLTHPKKVNDLDVSSTDLVYAEAVDTWYRQSSDDLVESL